MVEIVILILVGPNLTSFGIRIRFLVLWCVDWGADPASGRRGVMFRLALAGSYQWGVALSGNDAHQTSRMHGPVSGKTKNDVEMGSWNGRSTDDHVLMHAMFTAEIFLLVFPSHVSVLFRRFFPFWSFFLSFLIFYLTTN